MVRANIEDLYIRDCQGTGFRQPAVPPKFLPLSVSEASKPRPPVSCLGDSCVFDTRRTLPVTCFRPCLNKPVFPGFCGWTNPIHTQAHTLLVLAAPGNEWMIPSRARATTRGQRDESSRAPTADLHRVIRGHWQNLQNFFGPSIRFH